MTLISIQQVSKSFRGVQLFDQVSAEFEKGRIYGIVGPNGSGKSVLFKMICGFLKPDQGRITIDSKYRATSTGFPKSFGIIIDQPGYIAGKSGFQNLKQLANIQQIISDKEIKKAMEQVGLEPDSNLKVRHYSLGMKQKLALAQAFMENQEVLLLDEPFNALDNDSVQHVRQMLLDFKLQGKTIIFTSHNKEDIEKLSDHIYVINNRKLNPMEV